jgi:crotonobetainyl-CoA:carnitine CoA-transferase CaiB-like acyl-CoA transferase
MTDTRPLAGIRVIELSLAVAGPVAGQVLGDMGAEVIKVEAPFGRDATPSEFVPAAEGETARPWDRVPKFNELNRSKRSVVLDLADLRGRDVFLALVAQSDVVLENFSSRVLPNLGLDYDSLCRVKPDIILVDMPGFGSTGPYAQRLSYGPGVDAMSGLAHLTGYRGGGPVKPGNHYCDQNAGVLAALATMAALRHRRRTGVGQRIELAMLEGELQTVGEALLGTSLGATIPARIGNRDPVMAPHVGAGGGGAAGPGAAHRQP